MRNRLSWQKLRSSRSIIGASVLMISWFYLLWNTTIGEADPALRFRTKTTIAGVMEDGAAILSLNSVLTGNYQQWMSRSIGVLSPMFKTGGHLEGSDLLHVFGVAASTDVVVGENQQLLENVLRR